MASAPPVNYSSSQARQHFSALLDAAEHGSTVTVTRGGSQSAVVSAQRLREHLAATTPAHARTDIEDGVYLVFLEGRPFVSEGETLDAAVADLIEALREYAQDWGDRLQHAPNHAGEWGLVQLVNLSTDEQLAAWLRSPE